MAAKVLSARLLCVHGEVVNNFAVATASVRTQRVNSSSKITILPAVGN